MKKGLLKNPLVVAGLIIIAIGFVFVNNILPYMKSDEIPDETAPVEPVAQQDQLDIPVESEPLSQDEIQPIKTGLLLKNNLLKTQGWVRTTSRDPFENTRTDTENEKQAIVTTNTKLANVNVPIIADKVAKKPRVKEKSILKAISIGTTEKVALIGSSVCHEGDTCSLGVVKKIDPDSVIIAGPNGIRILHLK
ncbi:MAG: hypothetical protein ACM31E_10480 [Fibrobacterota bacterium]|nr:hypothetical protein [Chitinispirillaceae bacterium]